MRKSVDYYKNQDLTRLHPTPFSQSFVLKSPTVILFTVALSVFIAETIVMMLLPMLPAHSLLDDAILDATLLVIFISPTLYFLLFKPLVNHIREREIIEELLRKNEEEQFKLMIRSSLDGFWVSDKQGKILDANYSFCKLTGYTREELLEMNLTDLDSTGVAIEQNTHIQTAIATGSERFETLVRCKDTVFISVEASINYGDLYGGRLYCFVRDITTRKQTEEKIHRLAHYDALTDLPNRRLLTDRLQRAIAHAKRNKLSLALMFIDLDKFKAVNDAVGHDGGDLLLSAAAKRLQLCMRDSDTLSRMGGDEFIVLLPSIAATQDAVFVAEKILKALKEPFNISDQSHSVTASIGIAVFPEHGVNEKMLITRADAAMYLVKHSGGNGVKIFKAEMEMGYDFSI
ncbi:MAG: sensor domain-containing diguanylate cyclase [Gallionella sp.]|nr:GGDEF domain-containing protein [Gallionella sp.]